jgi:hypothetical protein
MNGELKIYTITQVTPWSFPFPLPPSGRREGIRLLCPRDMEGQGPVCENKLDWQDHLPGRADHLRSGVVRTDQGSKPGEGVLGGEEDARLPPGDGAGPQRQGRAWTRHGATRWLGLRHSDERQVSLHPSLPSLLIPSSLPLSLTPSLRVYVPIFLLYVIASTRRQHSQTNTARTELPPSLHSFVPPYLRVSVLSSVLIASPSSLPPSLLPPFLPPS